MTWLCPSAFCPQAPLTPSSHCSPLLVLRGLSLQTPCTSWTANWLPHLHIHVLIASFSTRPPWATLSTMTHLPSFQISFLCNSSSFFYTTQNPYFCSLPAFFTVTVVSGTEPPTPTPGAGCYLKVLPSPMGSGRKALFRGWLLFRFTTPKLKPVRYLAPGIPHVHR